MEAWNGTARAKENVVNIQSLTSSLNEGMDAWYRDNEDTKHNMKAAKQKTVCSVNLRDLEKVAWES